MKRLAFGLVVLALASGSWAQLIQKATAEDLADKLTPPAPTTRSLRNLVPAPVAVDLLINFDFDSAQLQPSSTPLLDNLIQALNGSRLASLNFSIEGHTDAKGRADYNLLLSGRRADAVRQYLIAHGVATQRLTATGKGSSELLIAGKPMAAENRRVRVMLTP